MPKMFALALTTKRNSTNDRLLYILDSLLVTVCTLHIPPFKIVTIDKYKVSTSHLQPILRILKISTDSLTSSRSVRNVGQTQNVQCAPTANEERSNNDLSKPEDTASSSSPWRCGVSIVEQIIEDS